MMQLKKGILFVSHKFSLRTYIFVTVTIVLLLVFGLQARNSRINQDFLNAFVFVDEGFAKSTANFVAKSEKTYSRFDLELDQNPDRVIEFHRAAFKVKNWSDQLYYDIQKLKVEIIKYCDGDNALSLTPAEWYFIEKRERKPTFDIDCNLIIGKDNRNAPAKLMITKGKGKELKEKIEKYRDFLVSMIYYPSEQKYIMDALNTGPHLLESGIFLSWETYYFESFPMIAVIANLSKIQNDIRNAEANIIHFLLGEIYANDTKVNKLEAVVVAKSGYVVKGGEFEARILLAAHDSLQKPEIWIGPFHRTETGYELIGEGKLVPYDSKGRAMYKVEATTVGVFPLQGIMRINTPYWGVRNFPFYYEYQVGESKVP